jgi:hypothetical protein
MITYEEQLNRDVRWAFMEGSMHFERESAVHKTLERIARRLEDLGIPYAVAGGVAMFFHGFRRFTEVVDILVTPDGLKRIHDELEGLGYLPLFAGSKQLRDVESGVRVEFLVTGQFPGDGMPKPVAFPDPDDAATEIAGIRFLSLPKLLELKLASGMTNPLRLRDLADAQSLIQELNLPEDFGNLLNPFVREKFNELWAVVQQNRPQEE